MLFIFDMGGVVTSTAGEDFFESIAKRVGLTKEEFFRIGGKGKLPQEDLFFQMEKGSLTEKEFWRTLNPSLPIPATADWFRLLFHPQLNTETVSLIKELKSKGHRVVCGTNTMNSHYDNHISRGDYSYFDITYASIHMGVIKPDPDFWKLILDSEGYPPQETFFTDDKPENIAAAQSLGINSYLFDNAQGFRKFVEGI